MVVNEILRQDYLLILQFGQSLSEFRGLLLAIGGKPGPPGDQRLKQQSHKVVSCLLICWKKVLSFFGDGFFGVYIERQFLQMRVERMLREGPEDLERDLILGGELFDDLGEWGRTKRV